MSTGGGTDEELFAAIRELWERRDAPPADLTERMIASVAIDDVSREYALLTLESSLEGAVRSEQSRLTLQFSDGETSVLLHVSVTESGGRRVDGWSDPAVLAARMTQDDGEDRVAEVGSEGRFAFPEAAPGLATVRVIVRQDGELREFVTPQFEV
ncbi:hypothetical protein [Microbacterium sp. Marseille-Q6965]|uniref:hypothetical protein n=1 Tax=Microbacterium sp. Marseille-Q6965 TaxID=2965072 RepID=UPI0021B749D2|nr:hypothetical protein [Microbacterium sp. Marseille-Q6965]